MGFFDWITGRREPFPLPAVKPVYANGIREATQDQLTESLLGTELVDPDINLTAAQGGSAYYRRLSAGSRDLSPIAWDKALSLAYALWDSNPLARRIIDMTRDFAVGDGITVTANVTPAAVPEIDENDVIARERAAEQRKRATAEAEATRAKLQRVIDRYWNDSLNRMDLKLSQKVADLGLAGELYPVMFVNERNGHVRQGTIDPQQVDQIVTNPKNAEEVLEVVLKAPGAVEKPRLKVIRVNEDPQSASFGRLMGVLPGELAQNGDSYVGACFYFAVNKPSVAKRGRTDLLTVVDYVDAYDQIVFGEVDRSLLLRSVVWDTLMDGKSDTEIAEYVKTHGAKAPQPGSNFVHNEHVTRTAVTPDLKSADVSIGADLILSTISTGAGLPKHWLNGSMDVNRANGESMSEPAIRHLIQRQKYVGYMVEQLVTFQLDQAEMAGVLPKRAPAPGDVYPEPWPITVNTPEFRVKDLHAAGQTLHLVAQALATALADRVIDTDAAQEIFVAMAGQLGVELDLEDMRVRLKIDAVDEPPAVMPGQAPDIEDEVETIIASMRERGERR